MPKRVILLFMLVVLAAAMPAFAEEAQGTAPAAGAASNAGWGVLAAAFAIGVAAAAGAFAQGRAVVAACEGMARNPGASGVIRLMALIGLGFIESLVIYALIIAFKVSG